MTLLNTPQQIESSRVFRLIGMLKLETKGMKRRGSSAYAILKREFQLNGNKKNVLEQMQKLICPIHRWALLPEEQKGFGLAYVCKYPECTVVYWKGSTSTPANAETRKARQKLHAIFDPLWMEGEMDRKEAYAWLRKQLALPPEKCHIGMFDQRWCKIATMVVADKRGVDPKLVDLL